MSQVSHQPERRVTVRWNSTQQTSCHYATLEKIASRWAIVLNVSVQGIGLGLPFPMEVGQELFVELPCKEPATPKAVSAFVVHVQQKAKDSWSLGCVFSRPLTEDELGTLR